MILGVDLGSYAVKTSQNVSFLSKISQAEQFNEQNKIIYNNKTLYIGEGEFSTDWNKSLKANTLPLLFTAIYKSTKDTMNKIVLGLPMQQFKKNKEGLKELILNNKCGNINGRNIIIEDLEIVPEGAAVYYNLPMDIREKIGNKQLIIIVIGGRSTEICIFKEESIIGHNSLAVGMLNAYQDIVNHINTNFTEEFKLEDGEEIIKEGLFLGGKEQNINFIQPILKGYFDSIYKELQLKFSINKGYVYLTGGGSYIFSNAFRSRLKNIIVSHDPVYDNVKGFRQYGRTLWQEN